MSFNHPQSVRYAAGRLAVFVGLALVALVLAACTGAPPGLAEGVVTVRAPTAAVEKPVAAPTQVPAATRAPAPTQAQPSASLPAGDLTRSAEAGAR